MKYRNRKRGRLGRLIIPIAILCISVSCYAQKTNKNYETNKNRSDMIETEQGELDSMDNSQKSILVRGCDPIMALEGTKWLPPLLGNPECVATTTDDEFIEKLKSRKWTVVFFAPGACRFSAAHQPIPGGNSHTTGWTLEEYREMVFKHQGDQVQIVETQEEKEAVGLLKMALAKAPKSN